MVLIMFSKVNVQKMTVFVILLSLFMTFPGCTTETEGNKENITGENITNVATQVATTNKQGEYELIIVDGVIISEITRYTGECYENELLNCENSFAVVVDNKSDKSFRVLNFSVRMEGIDYHFSIKALLAGTRCFAVNLENKSHIGELSVPSVTLIKAEEYTFMPTLHLDEISISYTDRLVQVENISGRDLQGVTVFYKQSYQGMLFGGAAFQLFMGAIPKGQIVQNSDENVIKDGVTFIYSLYGDA